MFLDGTWSLPESISTLLGTPWPSHRGGVLLMKTFTVYENAVRFHGIQFFCRLGVTLNIVCRLPIYKLSREKEIAELAVLQAQFRSRVCDASFEIQLFESRVETDVFLSRYNRWIRTDVGCGACFWNICFTSSSSFLQQGGVPLPEGDPLQVLLPLVQGRQQPRVRVQVRRPRQRQGQVLPEGLQEALR